MISITPEAAAQIRTSAKEQHLEGLPLRVAAQRLPDGKFHYAMGFDEADPAKDTTYHIEGVDVVISSISLDLIKGMTIDFVEIDGEKQFIFLNPNDPNYTPPEA